jgi:hypothetical protein
MKTVVYRSIPLLLALVFGLMLGSTPSTFAQSTGCTDAAGGPVRCTPTPRPTDIPAQVQPTALPTNTPEPTAIPLIPLPTTGSCVASPASPVRVNVRETPSTDGKILDVILVNSTVPVMAAYDAFLKIEGVDGESNWVLTPKGFIASSALRFGGENCDRLVKIYPPSSTGPFILRQDTDGDGVDDTQYLTYKLENVLISSATDGSSGAIDPDNTTIFWPPFEPVQPIGLLLPAVQKVREAAARLGDGCDDTTVFDPSTGTPGCVLILDDLAIFCTSDVCVGGQTSGNNLKQLALATFIPDPNEPLAAAFMKLGDIKGESSDSSTGAVPLIPPLIFIPEPPTTADGEIECAEVTIGIGPIGISGCLLVSEYIVAFCISDICIY